MNEWHLLSRELLFSDTTTAAILTIELGFCIIIILKYGFLETIQINEEKNFSKCSHRKNNNVITIIKIGFVLENKDKSNIKNLHIKAEIEK